MLNASFSRDYIKWEKEMQMSLIIIQHKGVMMIINPLAGSKNAVKTIQL